MEFENKVTIIFSSKSQNESFARVAVAAFLLQFDPKISDLTDIKTAVSEAVTNAIIHGYENKDGDIRLMCAYKDERIYIEVEDKGRGIENVEKAREPLYTSKPELERSGLGFTVMESFMDYIEIISKAGEGTKIIMEKQLGKN